MNRDYLTGEAVSSSDNDFDSEDLQLTADMAEAREDDDPEFFVRLGLGSKE